MRKLGDLWHQVIGVMQSEGVGSKWNKFMIYEKLKILNNDKEIRALGSAFTTLLEAGAIERVSEAARGPSEKLILAEYMFDPSVLTKAKVPRLHPASLPEPIVEAPKTIEEQLADQKGQLTELRQQVTSLLSRITVPPVTLFPFGRDYVGKPIKGAPMHVLEQYAQMIASDYVHKEKSIAHQQHDLACIAALVAEMYRQDPTRQLRLVPSAA